MKTYQRYLMTGIVVLVAGGALFFKYWEYVTNPWTRDGQVRADVIQITPRVSGPIIRLTVKDNQFVKAGDLLFQIDPRTFEASMAEARAQYDKTGDTNLGQEKEIDAANAQVEAARAAIQQAQSAIKQLDSLIEKNKAELGRQNDMIGEGATSQRSVDRAKANYTGSVEQRNGAVAALAQSRAALSQAKSTLAKTQADLGAVGKNNASIREALAAIRQAELNLEFTQVKAPVDGYVTNLNLRLGSNVVANQPILALVDVSSYWVHGFFKETSIENIRAGDQAIVTLMTYPDTPIRGSVDSLGWGISQQDGSTGSALLPTVSPTFEWIRLAQRVPVRIHLTEVPKNVALRVGTTASVLIRTRAPDTKLIK